MAPELSEVDPDRDPVDVLADEFASRYRRGETPSITEYVQRYPEHADQIQSLFPSVALLEQLGSRPEADARPERQGSLPPHHQIGDFEILREIGRGGMGVVYEAVQQSLHRPVALKVLNTASLHSENQAKRFEREAQAAAQLHHTNIVPVFGVGEQDGLRYYVMQRIHGLGLDAVLAELSGSQSGLKGRRVRNREDSVSAQALAGVLISGELSKSSASGVALDRSHLYQSRTSGSSSSDGDGDTVRSHDATPSQGASARSAIVTGVPSSLVLRDDPSFGAGVRSSLILRDDMSGMLGSLGDPSATQQSPEGFERSPGERTHSFGRRYWRNIARIGMQIASGLQYAHSQGTLHRDIKPANILLDTDGTSWIADFGLAKVLESDNVTHTGDVVGTLRYMAPEQFQGEANARSDIYSLGLTLFELLTLRPAYDETDRQKLIARKLTPHDPPSLRKWAHDIPRDLETIVHKCLAYEANDRYATAGALLADLQAFVEDRPIQARQSTSAERLWRWCRRNPIVAGLSSAVALLLLLTAGLTSVGYVQQKNRASEELALRTEAENAQTKSNEERARAEQIAQFAFQAIDDFGQLFVSDDAIGTIEVDDEDSNEQLQVPAYSPDSAAIMEKLRASFDELAEIAGEDQRFLGYAAKADLRAGELHLRLNQWEQARAAFSRAIKLYEEVDEDPDDVETRLRLAKLYNGLGVALVYLREPDQTRSAQQRALALLSETTSGPEIQFELARTHYLMGCHFRGVVPRDDSPPRNGQNRRRDVTAVSRVSDGGRRESKDGNWSRRRDGGRSGREQRAENDREHLEQAATLFAQLTESHPSESHCQYWLSLCYLELARHFPRSPENDDGRERAVAILKTLVEEHPHKPDYLYQLSEAYELSYHQVMGRPGWGARRFDRDAPEVTDEQLERVERDLRAALPVSKRLLAQQPHVLGYAFSNHFLLRHLLEVLRAQEDYHGALEIWDQLQESREAFVEHFPDWQRFSGRSERGPDPVRESLQAQILLSEDKPEEARTILQSIVDRYENSERMTPGSPGRRWYLRREMAAVYRLLESCLTRLGERDQATKIREQWEAMSRDEDDPGRGSIPSPPRPEG